VERELCNIWKDVLNVSQVGIYDNFFRIGGDSIISIQVVSRARLKGLYFSIKDIFSNPTIRELSKVTTTKNTCGSIQAEQGLVSGSVPLTPIQHWFFSAKLDDNNHFNQAVMLEVSSKVNADMINKAINLLIKHHDALRHRYTKDKQRKWTQACIEINQEFNTDIISISNSLSDKEILDNISDKSTSIHKQINIENGPLIRTALFHYEDNNKTLLIVIHHLVVDGVSWRILIEDLNRICEDMLLNKNPILPQKTHSYQQWAQLLTEYALSNDIKKEYSYWNNLVVNIKALPTDFENKHATVGDMITVQTSLTEQETDVMLHKVPNAYNTQVNDILLTALTLAIGDWSNSYEIFLSLEGHGREDISNDIDTSRTVGWFTTIFPVYLKIEEPNDIGESIKAIKEELRAIPNKGIGYGILAYLLDKAVLKSHDNPSISFNYLGQWDNVGPKDNLFMHSPEPSGQSVSPLNKQSHLIDINAEIRNSKLDFFISYSNKHYKHQTIENIASLLSKRLRQLIDYCNQDNTIGYTPSDFGLSKSNKDTLNDRVSKISKRFL
jgi:non-ribosomal peptide synthase protein (TIGR01720 family)